MKRSAVIVFLFLAGCSTAYKLTHCHKPVVGDVRIVSMRPGMVVAQASVRGASESWFAVGSDKEHLSIESNHERREGTVIGEFLSLPPRSQYVLALVARNECGDTQVVAVRSFITPPNFPKT